ncbi:hypothetical protein ACFE04_015053 [Oxalis oulophora]
MDEEISRAHFFLRQRDEMIQDMTQQIRQMTEENYAMVHRLRNITTQNEKLAGKNEELKMNITRLRDAIGVRERDNFFMQEHRELALQQIQILEDENRRMSEEAFLQMDTIELHNARYQELSATVKMLRENNQDLHNQLGELQEERNALVQTSEWVKSQLYESPFEQFVVEADEELRAFMVDHHFIDISSRLELIKIAKHKDSSSNRDPILTRTKTKRMSKYKEQEETSSARNLETESPSNQAHETHEETTHVPINEEPSVMVIPATREKERISLPLPVNLIYDKLVADDKIHPIPARSWDILPRWYNDSKSCAYHSNEMGHGLRNCPPLLDTIDDLVRRGLLKFETPEASDPNTAVGFVINVVSAPIKCIVAVKHNEGMAQRHELNSFIGGINIYKQVSLISGSDLLWRLGELVVHTMGNIKDLAVIDIEAHIPDTNPFTDSHTTTCGRWTSNGDRETN